MTIRSRIFVGLGIILLCLVIGILWFVDRKMYGLAMEEAEAKAKIILDQNLAIHTYFSHKLKPNVFEALKGKMDDAYFDPVWMSSTHAVRNINQYRQKLDGSNYYYKECAVNARSPQNEADVLEAAFISRLNKDKDLSVESHVRTLDGVEYLQVLRRGETMEGPCLRCHSTPAAAPADMVKVFGPERSFGRSEGDVVSAISIRVPLAVPLAAAQRMAVSLSVAVLGLIALLGLLFVYFSRILFTIPLNKMRRQTKMIASDAAHLGDQLPLDFPGEWNDLATDFNVMSAELKDMYDGLERRVQERTAELRQALADVKHLSGLLPICASCKKVRDDKGYWQQIESYISAHSDADFSHSICPDCMEKLYPKLFKGNK